ncbi:MAG TPA: pitrilysin family protein [Thermoanaerobaculia bacterium]|nr:pitrilysin family protein [Thermoanaerobaculia bacterium]
MPFRIRLALSGLLLAAAATVAGAATAEGQPRGDIFPYKVQQTLLDNGLQVVVIPYDSPGTVAYYTVVRTGARDEVEASHSGFAHFFEHMMFRGTEKYSTDRYNEVMKRMGADFNAFTSFDETVYQVTGPASELESIMDLEADRFQNLKYSEKDFRTESLAVLGEYNKNFSNPVLPLREKLQGLAYEKHTYRHLPIGFLEDIQAMPGYYQYSLGFFNRFYRPENCTLLVVGDVEPQRFFELAQRYYGNWKRGYQKPAVQAEPPQTEPKKAHLDWPNPTRPYMTLGYHIPAFSTTTVDSAALDVIDELLFGDSAPLYQELVVEKQWVDTLSGTATSQRDPSLFTISVRAKSEDLLPKIKETIDRHVALLQKEPVDAKRLERIKSYLRNEFALALDTPDAVAEVAADMIALTGKVDDLNRLYEQYRKVTPADVQRLASQTFRPQNETQVTLAYKAPAASGKGGAQ